MKALLIKDDDLVIENGDFVYTEGLEEIGQAIERNITTRLTEFFLNEPLGTDYETLTRKGASSEEIKNVLTDAILFDERVLSITEIDVIIKERNLTCNFVAVTTDGNLQSEVII